MRKQNKARIADVRIHGFTERGNGLGSYDHPAGMLWSLEVPFTMPGDYVRVRLLRKRNGIYQCILEELLESSHERIPAKCIHFAKCGGCRWQHLAYENQLRIKEDSIKNRFSSSITPSVTFFPIIPCDNPWEYRNKMEYSFSTNKDGEKFLGLMMDSSRGKVLNLSECHLVHRWFTVALETVREWWEKSDLDAYHPYKDKGTLRTLIVREGLRTGERLVMLTVSGNPEYAIHKDQLKSFVAALENAILPPENPEKLAIFLRIQQIKKGMPTEFYEMQLAGPDIIQERLTVRYDTNDPGKTLRFDISPSAFFQPNTTQAEKIYSSVIGLAKLSSDDIVYDLYCGTGTLGICMANHVKEVIGVELSRESAHDAKANIKLNEISNMRIITGAVGEVLTTIHAEQKIPPPDVVVIDPPRAGLEPQAIRLLLTLKPKTLVYVSCNPATQASNVAELIEGGYSLECIQPVDQFPHTVHCENIAVLRRN